MTPGFAALQYFHYHATRAAIVCLVGSVFLALAGVAVRRGLRVEVYVSVVAFVQIGAVSYFRGGMMGPVLAWGVALPTAAALLGLSRGAIIWLVLWAAQVLALAGIEHLGLAPRRIEASPTGVLGGFAGTAAMLVIATVLMNRMREDAETAKDEAMRGLFRANKIEAIARLAGGVAHDFNNLLAVIAARSSVISNELGGGHRCQQDLAAIADATERGAALTRRLLAIGGHEDDVGKALPFDLNDVVRDVAKLLSSTLPDDVALEIRLATECLSVEADPERIHQVAMNLVLNARDALSTAAGDRKLVLSTALRADANGERVVLTVSDTGAGMPQNVVDNIFEPFFTTKDQSQGSGLGLAIVHGTLSALGGTVEVHSEVGRGTTMRIVLTRSDRVPEATAVAERESVEAAPPCTILLVEDDRAVRRATRRLLQFEGHEVIEAEDGRVALERRGEEVDVLLTDVAMPNMSGPELVRELRGRWPGMPVIFMSGYAGDQLDGAELDQDEAVFLQKPVRPAAFRGALLTVARAARRRSAP